MIPHIISPKKVKVTAKDARNVTLKVVGSLGIGISALRYRNLLGSRRFISQGFN